MAEATRADVVNQVAALVTSHYVFPDVAEEVAGVLSRGLATGRYPGQLPALAEAVTADLQSVNGDQHLRLRYHEEALPPRAPGDDTEEYTALARWAGQTCGGVACVRRLAGNVGYLDLRPVLFPVVACGETVTAAMTLVAATDALLIDLRGCLGGDPSTVAFLISYLWDRDPVQLTALRERGETQPRQSWTQPYVPGRRYGPDKPVYVLTGGTTFSGGEQLSYDLQQLGRATLVGERTRGGAHPREGFLVHPHLEVTVPVATAVSPRTGGSWEGTGVTPDVPVPEAQAHDVAYERGLRDVIAAGGAAAAEAREALAPAG